MSEAAHAAPEPPEHGRPNPIRLTVMRVWAIAANTFREAIRNRVLAVLLVFALGLMVFSLVLGQLSLHEEVRIIKDLGLAGVSIVGLVIALFLGVNLLSKELDKKTVYAIIPKPLHRWEFLLGKYVGLAVTMTALIAVMSAMLGGFVLTQGGHHGTVLLRAEILVLLELLLVVALAIFFSSFSSPYLSAMFTAALWIIGRNSAELEAFAGSKKLEGNPVSSILHGVVAVFPDFRMFYISGSTLGDIHGAFVSWGYVAEAAGYCLAYTVVALLLAFVIFSRRDLT